MTPNRNKIKMKVYFNELKRLTTEKLIKFGVLKADAEKVADCYATADLYGVNSHGVEILPTHLKRLTALGSLTIRSIIS